MPVSAEGRVEHQKLNQVAALLSPGWVFGVQLDYSCRLKSDHLTPKRLYSSVYFLTRQKNKSSRKFFQTYAREILKHSEKKKTAKFHPRKKKLFAREKNTKFY